MNENKTFKRTILEQQKFLEGMRREKLKNNIFVSELPESYDKKKIIQEVFKRITPNIQ